MAPNRPALFGTVLVHHPSVLTQPASLFALGMGVLMKSWPHQNMSRRRQHVAETPQ